MLPKRRPHGLALSSCPCTQHIADLPAPNHLRRRPVPSELTIFIESNTNSHFSSGDGGYPFPGSLVRSLSLSLKPPLDQRNFKGKVEDSHSYGFEHCSIIWNTGLRRRRSKGFFPMLLVSQGKQRIRNISSELFFSFLRVGSRQSLASRG